MRFRSQSGALRKTMTPAPPFTNACVALPPHPSRASGSTPPSLRERPGRRACASGPQRQPGVRMLRLWGGAVEEKVGALVGATPMGLGGAPAAG